MPPEPATPLPPTPWPRRGDRKSASNAVPPRSPSHHRWGEATLTIREAVSDLPWATHEDALTIPLRWRTPRLIFVNSMGDLFHDGVPDRFIGDVYAVMAASQRHTFQVLTKRHRRMRTLLSSPAFRRLAAPWRAVGDDMVEDPGWPLPNVWLGVSVEDQRWADIRIPALLDTPAVVRWISAEPLLGSIDLHARDTRTFGPQWLPAVAYGVNAPDRRAGDGSFVGGLYKDMYGPNLDWVVVGGESGAGARPMHLGWARSLREQCQAAGVAVFLKQLGGAWANANDADPKGGNWDSWPADLRVREFPKEGAGGG